jgi:hypothetical protein
MKNQTSQIEIYTDLLIVEALIGDQALLKTAQSQDIVSTIIERVKSYVESKVDPKDKTGSVINMLTPGAIMLTCKAMGMSWIYSALFGLVASIFHFDAASVLEKICNELKQELAGGKKVSSAKVKEIAQSAVESQNTGEPTAQEAEEAKKKADEAGIDIGQGEATNQADDGNFSFASQLRFAKLVRLATEDCFVREAGILDWIPIFGGAKAKHSSIMSKLLGVIFSVALASAGLLVAGDVINKLLGRDNSLDGTIHDGKPTGGTAATQQLPVSGRPTKPSYTDTPMNGSGNWIEDVPNNEASIQQMVLNFAKEVYPLEGQESTIEANPMFNRLVNMIVWYNSESAGGPIVYIPKMFTTKKQMVDSFVDTLPANIKA